MELVIEPESALKLEVIEAAVPVVTAAAADVVAALAIFSEKAYKGNTRRYHALLTLWMQRVCSCWSRVCWQRRKP